MKKKNLLRGLTSVFAAILAFSIVMTNTAMSYASMLNSALGISTGKFVHKDGAAKEDPIFYASDYGDVNHLTQENLDALLADEDAFVELEEEEGAVLLRNNNHALPLKEGERRVSLFGHTSSADPLYKNSSGGGNIDPTRVVSFYDAMKEKGFEVNETLYAAYQTPFEIKRSGFFGPAVIERPASFYTDELKATFADYSDAAIVVVGRRAGENVDISANDEEGISGLALHKDEADMLQIINDSGVFKKIILVVNSAFPIEMKHLDQYNIDAVLWIGTPGLVGFRGVADILKGEVNPSGHLVDTFATDSLSAAATQNFGNFNYVNADEVNEGCADSKIPSPFPINYVGCYMVYQEGIYVGYKYYETRYEDAILGQGNASGKAGTFASKDNWNYADEVLYPFGYGLSYTTFEQKLGKVSEENNVITAEVTVKNTGDVAGKSVVEVYVQTPYTDYDRTNRVEKSAIQLAGFGKTQLLAPGASETVTVTIDKYLIASYDAIGAKGYILDAGDYYLAIGDSAHDALNNVLAAKGATGLYDENGNAVTGDAAKTYHWTQSALDKETYSHSAVTGKEVTNLFEDADINYWIKDSVTYLTRQDWEGTFPTAQRNITATPEMIRQIDGHLYETPADAPAVSTFKQGVKNGISLVDMHGLDYDDPQWENFLDQLTLDEMAEMIDENFGQAPVASVMKPMNRNQDGPGGAAGPYFPGGSPEDGLANNKGIPGSCTTYVGQMVAASQWNKDMIIKRGDFIAEDCLFSSVTQLWSPGGDTHRSPLSGRNFEYYSEDGTLSYLLGAAQTKAMQAKGTAVAIKHFALNDQETNRNGVAIFANEQAIREIFLKAFEGAFTLGGATSTMTSYSRVGLDYIGHSPAMLRSLLRGEWGFKGANISDCAMHPYQHTIEGLVGGTDFWCIVGEKLRAPELKEYITSHNDGYLYKLLRESQHGFYYMLANSNLVNGLSSNMVFVPVTPWWQTALYIVIGVSAALTLLCGTTYVITAFGKKKQKN
ncbi:MAG: glycoside hydrolase family 3 C-terminal domain-containing protein [Clostridia bacterium]|nr:glycoside hydrolase family 3 C-terminal domain-containing protein [Clostridia bacterium]